MGWEYLKAKKKDINMKGNGKMIYRGGWGSRFSMMDLTMKACL